MLSIRLLLPAAVLCTACAVAAAEALDPVLLRHVPADARLLAGIDIATLKATNSGRALLLLAEAAYPRLKALSRLPGLDLDRDVHQVLLTAAGQANANHTIVLLRGALDPARWEAAGLRQQNFDNVTVLHAEPGGAAWVAILEDGVAALGSRGGVERMLAVRSSGEQPAAALLAKAVELSRQFVFWAISTAPTAELAAAMPESQVRGILRGDVMKYVVETRFGAEPGPPIRLRVEAVTRSDKEAAALAEVVKFFAEVLRFSAKIRGSKQVDPAAELLSKLELNTEGPLLRGSLVLDESQLARLVAQATELALP